MLAKENRRLKRRHLLYYLKITDRKKNRIVGHLVDITAEGMKLMMKKPIEPGETHMLRMSLPSEIVGKKSIAIDAKGVWCGKSVNPDYYDAGFQLTNIKASTLGIIHHLIRHSEFAN